MHVLLPYCTYLRCAEYASFWLLIWPDTLMVLCASPKADPFMICCLVCLPHPGVGGVAGALIEPPLYGIAAVQLCAHMM